MTFPSRVKIGPYIYSLTHTGEGEMDKLGTTDRNLCTIKIRPGQALCMEIVTVFHELLHAAVYLRREDLGQAGCKRCEVELGEEEYAQLMSATLVMILRDNPELRAYLFQELPR